MKTSDIVGLTILSVIYFLQGVLYGFTNFALPIILTDKGAPYSEIGILSLCSFSFMLKILWAPFLDKYYIESFGKRKSYIVPCKYLIGMMYFIYSFSIDAHIQNLDILSMLWFFLVLFILEATNDIATDGWILTILSEENVALGSTCQSFCQSLGIFFSQYILIQLTSVKFANDFIYSEPSNEPLITFGGVFKILGIINLIFALIVHIFKKEINPKTREFSSAWQVYTLLKGLGTNKNLRFIFLLLLTSTIAYFSMDLAGTLELIKRGLPMETLSLIGIATYPLQSIIPVYVAKYTLKKKEMQAYFAGMVLGAIILVMRMLTIYVYNGPESGGWALFLVFMTICLSIVPRIVMDVSAFAFYSRNCDESVGGTLITAMASVSNIPRLLCPSFGLMMLSFFNVYLVNFVCAVYQIWYIYKFTGKFISLQTAPKNVWCLDYVEHNDEYVEMRIQNEKAASNSDRTCRIRIQENKVKFMIRTNDK